MTDATLLEPSTDHRLTPEEQVARARQAARAAYALRHPRPIVVDSDLAVALARFDADARAMPIIDWSTIPHAREDDPREDEPARTPVPPRPVQTLRRPYVAALIEGAYDDVVHAEIGNRNNELARASFRYGQVVGADLLTEEHALAALEEAAARCGLQHREALSTIRSGLRAGAQHPLET
jgi:hypothetical protein